MSAVTGLVDRSQVCRGRLTGLRPHFHNMALFRDCRACNSSHRQILHLFILKDI
jgi:hypothetical protein